MHFSESWNFYKLKKGDLIFRRNQFFSVWIIWSPLLYFNFKSFMDPNSSSFIRSQCILHDGGVPFSQSWNFYKLKRWGSNFLQEAILEKVSIIWSPLSVFQVKTFCGLKFMVIHYISLHSAWLRNIFLRVFKCLQIKEGGPNFYREPILQKLWIIWSAILYFNLKSFLDPNSLSFIRFQWILHDSGILFSGSWNFDKLKKFGPNFWG